jgi:hypothetical protein
MAKVYLRGSDIEAVEANRLPRLLGIAHETYEKHTINVLGNNDYVNRVTKYCFSIIQHPETSEYALEIDDAQNEYTSLPTVHANRLISRATMEADGWFIDE